MKTTLKDKLHDTGMMVLALRDENDRLKAKLDTALEFAERVARSACLRQIASETCICFACEAHNLITRATGRERGA